jgi:hypothetical protein
VRVGSCFHVLRSRTSFRRYRGRRLLFSCFARQNSFSTVPTASGPVFMFCAPGHVFGGTEGVGFLYHAMRSQTLFRWSRGRQVLFSYFTCPDLFSAVLSASATVFLFCTPGLIFGHTEGGSMFMFCAP